MQRAKELKPVTNKTLYSKDSKKIQAKVKMPIGKLMIIILQHKLTCYFVTETQEISHSVTVQKLTSKDQYTADFKEEMVGKPPKDITKAYPEHDHHKNMTKLASKVHYKPT